MGMLLAFLLPSVAFVGGCFFVAVFAAYCLLVVALPKAATAVTACITSTVKRVVVGRVRVESVYRVILLKSSFVSILFDSETIGKLKLKRMAHE